MKLLVLFYYTRQNFWEAELLALAELFECSIILLNEIIKKLPYVWIQTDNVEGVKRFCERSVLIRGIYEIWAEGIDDEELFRNFYCLPLSTFGDYLEESQSFKISITSFNKKLSVCEKNEIIEKIISIPFRGKVDLENPNHVIQYLAIYNKEDRTKASNLFIGKEVSVSKGRYLVHQYKLNSRVFVGTTSMCAELSLLCANLGKIKESHLVFDPCVGTASLLLACAHFGAYVGGSDIDSRAFAPRDGASLATCFEQYRLTNRFLDVMIGDISHPCFRAFPLFDAVICDPPYGVREDPRTCRRDELFLKSHFRRTRPYTLSRILHDLLDFSARRLIIRGRLVFWLPTFRPKYSESKLPSHPSLTLISNSEDPLTFRWSRRLLVMEKTSEYEENGTDLPEALSSYYNSFRLNIFSKVGAIEKEIKI